SVLPCNPSEIFFHELSPNSCTRVINKRSSSIQKCYWKFKFSTNLQSKVISKLQDLILYANADLTNNIRIIPTTNCTGRSSCFQPLSQFQTNSFRHILHMLLLNVYSLP